MSESAGGRIAAAVAMVTCCGSSMAIALGIVAFSSTLVVWGLAVAVGVGCVVFTTTLRHRRHRHGADLVASHD